MPQTALPTERGIPLRAGDFPTLVAALDHAAGAATGMTFHGPRGETVEALAYARLAREAREIGARLLGLGLAPGDRVGLVAETDGDFVRAFMGAVLAGLVPCPMPLPTAFGSSAVYAGQLRRIAEVADVAAVILAEPYRGLVAGALDERRLAHLGPLDDLRAAPAPLPPAPEPDAVAYLQFSSGTTRTPRGIAVTHRALMANIAAMAGAALGLGPDDRGVSWLPFYHDMGLVGCMLLPVATQMSIDYLATRDFIRRPGLWLSMIGAARATLSYAPSFGYHLAAERARIAGPLDLSAWRIAGVGGDMIKIASLEAFARAHEGHGFRPASFLPSYGMAELALGFSFAAPGGGCRTERLDPEALGRGEARPAGGEARHYVRCGRPLPGHAVEIRDGAGRPLPARRIGRVFARGPSVMQGYFRDPAATAEALSPDGWLETGDTGYLTGDGDLVITGRSKDLVIVNGRNIWPQDVEWTLEHHLPDLRQGGVAAFGIETTSGAEGLAVVIESRAAAPESRERLRREADRLLRQAVGVAAEILFSRPGTLPRTSSGKMSRALAREMHRAGRFER